MDSDAAVPVGSVQLVQARNVQVPIFSVGVGASAGADTSAFDVSTAHDMVQYVYNVLSAFYGVCTSVGMKIAPMPPCDTALYVHATPATFDTFICVGMSGSDMTLLWRLGSANGAIGFFVPMHGHVATAVASLFATTFALDTAATTLVLRIAHNMDAVPKKDEDATARTPAHASNASNTESERAKTILMRLQEEAATEEAQVSLRTMLAADDDDVVPSSIAWKDMQTPVEATVVQIFDALGIKLNMWRRYAQRDGEFRLPTMRGGGFTGVRGILRRGLRVLACKLRELWALGSVAAPLTNAQVYAIAELAQMYTDAQRRSFVRPDTSKKHKARGRGTLAHTVYKAVDANKDRVGAALHEVAGVLTDADDDTALTKSNMNRCVRVAALIRYRVMEDGGLQRLPRGRPQNAWHLVLQRNGLTVWQGTGQGLGMMSYDDVQAL